MSEDAGRFAVGDIRPKDLMHAKESALEADIQFLRDRRSDFVQVPCPACGDDLVRSSFDRHGFTYNLCSACETLYMSPRAPESIMLDFYVQSRNYAFWNEHIYPASEEARRSGMYRPRAVRLVELCGRYGAGHGALLEVGAAFGTFCDEVRSLDHFDRVIAMEPTPELANTLRERGFETIEAPIETAELAAGAIDVIVAWEVIEHLFDPTRFLMRVHRLLRPGGLLLLSCPNVKGFDSRLLAENWSAIDHEHVNYFHPASLSLLLSRRGFDVLETETPGRLDVELSREAFEAGLLDPAEHPLLHDLIVEKGNDIAGSLQDAIARLGLSSHQWALARKRQPVKS